LKKNNTPPETLEHTGWAPQDKIENFRGSREPDSGASKLLEDHLRSSLQASGSPDRNVEEILTTTVNPTPYSYKHEYLESGTKLYAFASLEPQTGEYGIKGGKSPYYCMAEDIEQLERESLLDVQNQSIDRMAIKDRLALPCYNHIECLVEIEITHSHTAVRTMIGEAEETFIRDGMPRDRQMQGGGWQIHPNVRHIDLHSPSPEKKYAQIATWPPGNHQKAKFIDFKTKTQQQNQETLMQKDNNNFSSLKVPSLKEVLQKRQKDDKDLSKLKVPPVPTKDSKEKATEDLQQDSSALSPGTPSRKSLSERVEQKKPEQKEPFKNKERFISLSERVERKKREQKEPSKNKERSIDRGLER